MSANSIEYENGYRSSFKFHRFGTMNIILSAPHGGTASPTDVEDRTEEAYLAALSSVETSSRTKKSKLSTTRDIATDEFTENVANELHSLLNLKPFVIIGKWHRKKVDFNRDLLEGTLNNGEATAVYQNYHQTLNNIVDHVNDRFGSGLLIDIHGHGQGHHSMLGYLLTSEQLAETNLSIKSFATSMDLLGHSDKEALIRGVNSFGNILENNGFECVIPSQRNPKPQIRHFLSGGFITKQYSQKINTIQTELPNDVRAGTNRHSNAQLFARSIIEYMRVHHILRSIP